LPKLLNTLAKKNNTDYETYEPVHKAIESRDMLSLKPLFHSPLLWAAWPKLWALCSEGSGWN